MILNKFAYLYSKPLGNHTLKNIAKNTWKFTKKPGNIMEFCLSEKVGTLANWIDGRRTINFQQECIPVGCVPSAAITISGGGVCLGAQGGGGICVSQQSTGQTPPPPLWTEFLTRACESITFPQLLLRTVKIMKDSEVGWGTRPLKLLHHCCLWVQKFK